jgi:D-amino peptidase
MKIYVSADMEGVSGITHPAQCRPNHPDYGRFRRLMTEEVNAAVAGAVEAGATEVLVNDGHLTMTNVTIEDLHPAASLISGTNKLLGQMEGIDESFDGVFFVGYHQGDGQGDGVINHTHLSVALRSVRINGELADEAYINAGVAGAFGVPVALLTGDDLVCARAGERFEGITVARTKRAIDRLTAENRPVQVVRELICEKAAAATRRLAAAEGPVAAPEGPIRFEMEFRSTSAAQICLLFGGVERVSPTAVTFERDTYLEAVRQYWGLAILGHASHDGVFGRGY